MLNSVVSLKIKKDSYTRIKFLISLYNVIKEKIFYFFTKLKQISKKKIFHVTNVTKGLKRELHF